MTKRKGIILAGGSGVAALSFNHGRFETVVAGL